MHHFIYIYHYNFKFPAIGPTVRHEALLPLGEHLLPPAATLHLPLLRGQTLQEIPAPETRRGQDHPQRQDARSDRQVGIARPLARQEVRPQQEQGRQRGVVPQQRDGDLGTAEEGPQEGLQLRQHQDLVPQLEPEDAAAAEEVGDAEAERTRIGHPQGQGEEPVLAVPAPEVGEGH